MILLNKLEITGADTQPSQRLTVPIGYTLRHFIFASG